MNPSKPPQFRPKSATYTLPFLCFVEWPDPWLLTDSLPWNALYTIKYTWIYLFNSRPLALVALCPLFDFLLVSLDFPSPILSSCLYTYQFDTSTINASPPSLISPISSPSDRLQLALFDRPLRPDLRFGPILISNPLATLGMVYYTRFSLYTW